MRSPTYAEADNVQEDTIFEQTESGYDPTGNTTLVIHRQRYHSSTGTGPLAGPSGGTLGSLDSYSAAWFDPVGRQVAAANYGVVDQTQLPFVRPDQIPTTDPVEVLVTTTAYDDAGRPYSNTDPAGRESRVLYDDAGRVTTTIDNYVDGEPDLAQTSEDVTVTVTYNADGLQETLTAVNVVPRYGAPGSGVTATDPGTISHDAAGIDFLYREVHAGNDDYDIDGDGGPTDQYDVDAWVRGVLGTEYGDIELDGDVDFADFAYFAAGFLDDGGWADGDFDGDGHVDFTDKAIFEKYFGFPDIPPGELAYQTTTYVYGSTVDDSGVARSDLLRAVIYPDSDDTAAYAGPVPTLDDGADGAFDRVQYTYNRLGQQITYTDQNGTEHTYTYDDLGRVVSDSVTALGANVDDSVMRIDRSYEVRGLLEWVTSYDADDDVVNEVKRTYNEYGQLVREYQEHEGAVVSSGADPSLWVAYTYSDAAHGLRPTKVFYPNHVTEASWIFFGYGGQEDSQLNRLKAIRDVNNTILTVYGYVGLSTIYMENYAEPDVKLDYRIGPEAAPYKGWDRFGRVADQVWVKYGAGNGPVDRYRYGYDPAGNRTYRENIQSGLAGKFLDETYTYDGVNRLTGVSRGDYNATTGQLTNLAFAQDWGLDATGNWQTFDEDSNGNGTYDLEQLRTSNAANEIADIWDWRDPAYDATGNMTTMPQPDAPADAFEVKYDAWNRLVEVSDGGILIAKYEYDGTGRRIVKQADTEAPAGIDHYEHYYYNGVQMIEMRDTDNPSAVPKSLAPDSRYIWSPRYIDALILRDRDTNGDGDFDQRLYYLSDANMNVTALFDSATRTVVERYVYDPYGKVTVYNANWSATQDPSEIDNAYLYTGRRLDAETGLYFYRARYYHPGLGAFVARDPLGMVDGANLYNYVLSNPLLFVDPLGLEVKGWRSKDCVDCCILIILLQYDPKSEEGIGPGDLAGNVQFKDSALALYHKLTKDGERVIGLSVNSVSTTERGFDLLRKAVEDKLNEPDVKKNCRGVKQIVVLGHGTGTQDKPGLKWPTLYATNPDRQEYEREENFAIAGTDIGFDIGGPLDIRNRIRKEALAKQYNREPSPDPFTLYEALFYHSGATIRQIDLESCYSAKQARQLQEAWSKPNKILVGGYTGIANFGGNVPPRADAASLKIYYPRFKPGKILRVN